MKNYIKILWKSSVIFSLLVLLICQGCNIFRKKNDDTEKVIVDTISVDENLEPVMKILLDDYDHLKAERKLFVQYEPTKNCIADLVNGKSHFCMTTRQFSNEENDYISKNNLEFTKFDVAVDAVAFIVNPENPVERVTSDDLKAILTGKYTKWTDLDVKLEMGGNPDEQNKEVRKKMSGTLDKIRLYIQRQNSGTYDFVKDSVLNGLDYTKSAYICSTSSQMLEMVRNNRNSIGISNLSWLSRGNQDSLDASVRPLRISKIFSNGRRDEFRQLHIGLVYQKKYPYFRYVYLYATRLVALLNSHFINYVLKTKGQSIFLENGLVPLNQPVRVIQLN